MPFTLRPYTIALAALALAALAAPALAQEAPQTPQPAPNTAQAPATPLVQQTLQKVLDAYASAKTYQGTWTYASDHGLQSQKMTMEIKARNPAQLSFHIAPAAGQKRTADDGLPELLVVVDGKTASFENATEKVWYRVALPANPRISPLMFIPQLRSFGPVRQREETVIPGGSRIILEADTANGGVTRMEVDPKTYRIRRITSEVTLLGTKETSSITVDRESFDGDISGSAFSFHPVGGAKEIPAPPDAQALFGPPVK